MKTLFISLITLLPLMSFAGKNTEIRNELTQLSIQDSQCHDAHNGNTASIRGCQGEYYKALDLVLNREYQIIMKNESDLEIKERFKQSQRDWLKFRDSNCKWQGSQMLGGTGEPVLVNGCYNSMLVDRIEEIINHFYFDL